MELEFYSSENYAKFLVDSALYVKKSFKKHPEIKSFDVSEVEIFCMNCQKIKPFKFEVMPNRLSQFISKAPPPISPVSHKGVSISNSSSIKNEITECSDPIKFRCVTCKELKKYHIYQSYDDDQVTFEKYGEYPRKQLDKDKELNKFFKEDKDNYDKAIVCLAQGYGIAAHAYLRRIIENNIFKLLDLINADSTDDELTKEMRVAIAELKVTSPMSDKIAIANKALPGYLKPNGLNPLGRMYKLLSEGVHSLTDEECLEKANNLNACLKYLVSELADHKKNKDNFAKMLGAMK